MQSPISGNPSDTDREDDAVMGDFEKDVDIRRATTTGPVRVTIPAKVAVRHRRAV